MTLKELIEDLTQILEENSDMANKQIVTESIDDNQIRSSIIEVEYLDSSDIIIITY